MKKILIYFLSLFLCAIIAVLIMLIGDYFGIDTKFISGWICASIFTLFYNEYIK